MKVAEVVVEPKKSKKTKSNISESNKKSSVNKIIVGHLEELQQDNNVPQLEDSSSEVIVAGEATRSNETILKKSPKKLVSSNGTATKVATAANVVVATTSVSPKKSLNKRATRELSPSRLDTNRSKDSNVKENKDSLATTDKEPIKKISPRRLYAEVEEQSTKPKRNTKPLDAIKETPNKVQTDNASKISPKLTTPPQKSANSSVATNDSIDVIEASQDQTPSTNASNRYSFRRISKTDDKTPTTPKSIQTSIITIQNMDTLPIDTECIDEMIKSSAATEITPIKKSINCENNNINAKKKKMSEMDTEPNTEEITTSLLNNTMSPIKTDSVAVTECHTPVPADKLNKSISSVDDDIVMEQSFNQSILCSPQLNDVSARNAELLNSTFNISPILEEKTAASAAILNDEINIIERSPPANSKAQIETITKLHNNSPISSIIPLNQQTTPINRLQSSTPTISSAQQSASRFKVPLKGRGAQILNLINRNRELASSPVSTTISKLMQIDDLAPPSASGYPVAPIIFTTEQTINPSVASTSVASSSFADTQPEPTELTYEEMLINNKDLLQFSKTLPSPMASPSFSILKRKLNHDEDVEFESPTSKRKRVSFHDPPVSGTKQFISYADEHHDRSKYEKDLLRTTAIGLTRNKTTDNTPENPLKNNTLRRQSRADSMVEIAKFSAKTKPATTTTTTSPLASEILSRFCTDDNVVNTSTVTMDSLKWNESTDNTPGANKSNITSTKTSSSLPTNDHDDIDNISITPSPSIICSDKNAILENIFDEYSIEDLLEKYLDSGRTFTPTSARFLTKELSQLMRQNDKICSETLDQLSENHSKEFLMHAVQENLASSVCARLTPNVVLEYVRDQAKTNLNIRTQLLEECASIINCPTIQGGKSAESPEAVSTFNAQLKKIQLNILDLIGEEAKINNNFKEKIQQKCADLFETALTSNGEMQLVDPKEFYQFILSLLNQKMPDEQNMPDEFHQFLLCMLKKKMSAEQICQWLEVIVTNRNRVNHSAN